MIRFVEGLAQRQLLVRHPELGAQNALRIVRSWSQDVTEMLPGGELLPSNISEQQTLSFDAFIRLVLDALLAAQVEYMIGGAVASAVWGEARTTADVDFVIHVPAEQIYALSQELAKRDMLVPFESIIDLLLEDCADLLINTIHLRAGYKAELFLLRSGDALRASALRRKRLVDMGSPIGAAYVHAPEDLILYKLQYYQLSQQTKHVRDIQSILLNQGKLLDFDHLSGWVERLGLNTLWQEINRGKYA